ncbi:15724_t:CDS:1, partial [Funneliformis caledonium]
QLQGDGQARIVGHLSPTVPAGLNAQLVTADAGVDALVISGHTVFNEDWTPAGGKLTSKVVCTPNANLPNRTVVLADITLEQLIDYFKENYPTVRQQYQQALFGITVQESDSVDSYYTKLKKIARHANMEDDEFRRKFLEGLSSDNQMEVHHMGLSRPIDEIFSSLEEIERYKAEL